jgi:hypothetical protein
MAMQLISGPLVGIRDTFVVCVPGLRTPLPALLDHTIFMLVSHLTTDKIISRGDYLLPDFDPEGLKVMQLIGIFYYHQIPLLLKYTKAKLIKIFNGIIKANWEELR